VQLACNRGRRKAVEEGQDEGGRAERVRSPPQALDARANGVGIMG